MTENVRLIEPLGEGGMGSVWLADHLGLRTRVAVKFIAPELLEDDPDMVKRFRREAGAAARIKSPHVVQTLDHGVMDDGTPYIVMELLEGESLAQRLERSGTLPLEHIAEILTQVARGLGRAHSVGIVHRDIKPDNVFLLGGEEDELFVKLLDFGVAKHTHTPTYSVVTGTGAMIGTPGYMSPEQVLTGKDVDLRSDLWSLAVVVYHAMIGDIPFQGETLGALCVSITRGAHTPPSRVRAGVPASVDAWMARALALDPSRRFQSAKELAVTFRSALHGVTAWASAEELSTVRTVIAGEDALPTVQLPTPLRGTGTSGAHGTVVMATTGEQPRQPATAVAAPIAEPSTVVLEDENTRRRDRATRAARRRWLLAITVAALGFFTGFAIVLLARPREDDETLPVTSPPPVSDTSVTAPSAEVPTISSETPPAASSITPAEPRVRPRPRPATPPPSQPHVTPPAPPPPPRPVSKDRGF